MLLTKLINYIKGYLVIRVSGRYPERFLNVCAARGILLWDAVRFSDRTLRCKISIRGFRLLPDIAAKTGVRVKILSKQGLPIAMHRYRKRKWFAGGVLAFLLAMIVLNQFVWEIEITGNEKIPSNLILNELEACGLKIGAFRMNIDEKKIKNEMLIKMPELSWLWPDKNGSKIVVNVKEKLSTPEIFDPNDYCNILALKDGVIDSMIVKNGIPSVKLGDTVQKGSILVSGMITSERNIETRFTQAEAEVYARTWYEKTKAFSRIHTRKIETGEVTKKRRLKLFGRELNLFLDEAVPYENYTTETEKHELSLFGKYGGITLTTDVYKEIQLEDELQTEASVIEAGIKEVEDLIDEMVLPNSQLVRTEPTYHIIDEDTLEVTVVAEYIENIAQKVKAERPPVDPVQPSATPAP